MKLKVKFMNLGIIHGSHYISGEWMYNDKKEKIKNKKWMYDKMKVKKKIILLKNMMKFKPLYETNKIRQKK